MLQNTHVKSFLEMLAVERGVNETTRQIYRRTLQTFATFLVSRGRGVEDAQAEDIQAYLAALADASQARRQSASAYPRCGSSIGFSFARA